MRGQDKTLLARHAYYPYGTTLSTVGLPLNRGFTGHQWEPETGQYFAPFRYYNPSAARWTMRDPLGYVDGPNMYGYVGGMPVTKKDSLGLITSARCFQTHNDKVRTDRNLRAAEVAYTLVSGLFLGVAVGFAVLYATPAVAAALAIPVGGDAAGMAVTIGAGVTAIDLYGNGTSLVPDVKGISDKAKSQESSLFRCLAGAKD